MMKPKSFTLADALARHTQLSLKATQKRLAAARLPRKEITKHLAAHSDELAQWRSSILRKAE